eukprot:scaffold31783_cov129-Isochrysis_galbana.AAC.2
MARSPHWPLFPCLGDTGWPHWAHVPERFTLSPPLPHPLLRLVLLLQHAKALAPERPHRRSAGGVYPWDPARYGQQVGGRVAV